jgi:hypothetical protein
MSRINAAVRNGAVIAVLLSLAVLGAAPANAVGVPPEEDDVVEIPADAAINLVGGASNGGLLWLDFDNDRALALNDPKKDAIKGTNVSSLTFFDNTCAARQDIIAADTGRGQLLLYAQDEYAQGAGEGINICDAISCPHGPGGLSTSSAGLLAAADLETRGVWIFAPKACEDADLPSSPFSSFDGGGFTLGNHDATKEIAATGFVHAAGGGLLEGDMLVLARTFNQGWTIARIRAAAIASLLAGELAQLPAAEPLLPAHFFGPERPTGFAWVPGEEQNAVLLVTLKEGRVLQLLLETAGDGAFLASSNELAIPPSFGGLQRPQAIATGRLDAMTLALIADEKNTSGTDRFVRLDLEQQPGGGFSVAGVRALGTTSAPRGVAILSEEDDEQRCVDFTLGDTTTTGCILEGAIQVHLSMGYDGTLPPGARVSAQLALVPDPRPAGSNLPLKLEVAGDENFLPGGGEYRVPASCRGFPVDDERFGGVPQLVLLNMGLNFEITPSNFIQVRELAIQSLGLDETLEENQCDQTGARIYYHPQDDNGGTLFDTTFSCQNPSRSIVENFSPIVFCADPLYLARKFPPPREKNSAAVHKRLAVNREIRDRIDAIKQLIAQLPNTPELVALAVRLEKDLNTANSNASGGQPKYLDALGNVNDAALDVFAGKRDLDLFNPLNQPGVDPLAYGRLLSRLLALAFYISETGALAEYRPPAPFCELIYDVNGDGQAEFPELPDVFCAAP